jgi:hypothetical protein
MAALFTERQVAMVAPNAAAATQPNYDIAGQARDLIRKRIEWETGAYRTSNEQLYKLLASAYELYLMVSKGSYEDHKAFKALLTEHGVERKASTPLEVRVARLVFGSNGKRTATYGRVLFAARKAKVAIEQLPSWIADKNGVEEVKHVAEGKISPAQQAKVDAERASDYFVNADGLVSLGVVPELLVPSDAEHQTYSLALVRVGGGNEGEIVWGTANASAISKVLEIAGKGLRAQADEEALEQAKQLQAAASAEAVTQAVQSAKVIAPK